MKYRYSIVHKPSGKVVDIYKANTLFEDLPEKYQTDNYILIPIK